MSYVDGFVLPIPRKNLKAYRLIPFPRAIGSKAGETVVFSWIVYKSRSHRDRVNAKVMKDPRLRFDESKMPFDIKRMLFGGFKTIVDAR